MVPKQRKFNYTESQLGCLEITGVDRLTQADQNVFDRVLSYYADRYNPWEITS